MGLSDDWKDVGGEKRIDFYHVFFVCLYVVSHLIMFHFGLVSRGFLAATLSCPECLAMNDH